MASDSGADAELRERVAALEETVAEQQQASESPGQPTASRRGFLSAAAAVAGLGALGVYSSYPASAQAAGQIGTSSDPVDVEAWSLNVQDQLAGDLDAGGNRLTNVAELETDIFVNGSDEWDYYRKGVKRSVKNPVWESSNYGWTTVDPDNPTILRTIGTGKPSKVNGYYWMAYFAGGNIGLARSLDLINWEDTDINPVLNVNGGESWESESLIGPYTFMDGRAHWGEDDFWLFYGGLNSFNAHKAKVGVATTNSLPSNLSRDTTNNPVFEFLQGDGVEDFSVVLGSDGNWKAVYEEEGLTNGVALRGAETTDAVPNTGWTDKGKLLPEDYGNTYVANGYWVKDVVPQGTIYYLFYEGINSPGDEYAEFVWSYESDLFRPSTWRGQQRILFPSEDNRNQWEESAVIPNAVVNNVNDENIFVLYTGGTNTKRLGALAINTENLVNNSSFPNETYIEATRSNSVTGIASGTYTNIFDGAASDNRDEFNSSSQFVPDETAKYRILGRVSISNLGDGDLIQARVRNVTDGSVPFSSGDMLQTEAPGSFAQNFDVSLIGEFNAGDEYEFRVRNNDGQFNIDNSRAVITREFSSL